MELEPQKESLAEEWEEFNPDVKLGPLGSGPSVGPARVSDTAQGGKRVRRAPDGKRRNRSGIRDQDTDT